MGCSWLNKDDKIKGFEWHGGTERVTTGIQIWSKPFILKNKFGEEVFAFASLIIVELFLERLLIYKRYSRKR